jgi:hypothetical protein
MRPQCRRARPLGEARPAGARLVAIRNQEEPVEKLRASAPPAPRLPLEDRSMLLLERAVAVLAFAAAVLVSLAR